MTAQIDNINLILQGGSTSASKRKASDASPLQFALKKRATSDVSRNLSLQALLNYGKKVKTEELYTFANQLSTLLSAGVPLLTALQILSEQTENKLFKKTIEDIEDSINAGSTLTQAIGRHPRIFPKLFVSMVRAAEKSGQMAEILGQLSNYLKQQHKIRKKVKAATAYPKFIFFFFLIVLAGIIFGLVPRFKSVFESFGATLPLPTQILLTASHLAREYLLYEVLIIVALIVLYKRFKKTPKGELVLEMGKMKLPIVGDLVKKSAISKFCRTLAMLIRSGVSLVDALDIAGATTESIHFTKAIQNVKSGVLGGESLQARLKQHAIFPIMVVSMVATGEQSGSLDQMLNGISDLYDTNVDTKITGLSSILEPALMIGLGVVALIVIIALYLPIFFMSNVIN
ncbi:type II secretion system F family protein [bacterium]|nr:type II secretion system F family protein [bacterium]